MSDKKPVLLIDLSSIFHQKYRAQGDGMLSPIQATIGDIEWAVSSNHDRLVAICCDSKKSFRKEIHPEYKANRERDATLYETLDQCKAKLKAAGFLLWECEGFEADDVIATAWDKANSNGHAITVVSSDKDLLQLVRDPDGAELCGSVQLSPATRKLMDVAAVKERFKVEPWKIGDFLALKGDKSDNIKGAEGIGDVTAAELLNTYGDLDGIYVAVKWDASKVLPLKKPGEVSKAAQSLIDNESHVRLARKLVTLRFDAPINFEEIYKVQKMDDDFSDAAISSGATAQPSPVQAVQSAFPGATEVASTNANDNGIMIGEVVPTEKALVVQESKTDALAQFDANLQPTGMAGMWWLAARAIASGMYAKKFAKPEQALMTMVRGRDFGLSPAASLELLHYYDGRVCPPAQLMCAMAKRSSQCEYFIIEGDDTQATARTKRKGSPKEETVTYTVDMAKTAGLAVKDNWKKNPGDMCVARASGKLSRRVYPEETCGAYSFEEMDDAR